MASMRDWLKDPQSGKERVIVVHCKAGKGRSGTVACSYLISQEGWTVEDALTRFTARRMRNGFGNGVSIPSQLRWVGYVEYWSKHQKIYVERMVEILEVHVWGMRDGVKVSIDGYVEEGKLIKTFHTFAKHERTVMDSAVKNGPSATTFSDHLNQKPLPLHESKTQVSKNSNTDAAETALTSEPGTVAAIFRPAQPIILPTSDVNIDFERRNKAAYGFTMVTSVAHVWFNTFFESQHSPTTSHDLTKPVSHSSDPPINSSIPDSGVFEITWEAMDGIKGSARKGTRALDRLAVVWRAVPESREGLSNIITEPAMGEPVPESKPADWTKANQKSNSTLGKDLGIRTDSPSSANVSRASSMVDVNTVPSQTLDLSESSAQSHIPADEEKTERSGHTSISDAEPTSLGHTSSSPGGNGPTVELGLWKVNSPSHSPAMAPHRAGITNYLKAMSTRDLKTAEEHWPGQIVKNDEHRSS